MAVDLDEVDWQILRVLQGDARISYTDLARRVHLGASATSERVKRLEASGVITGYSAVIDLEKVGISLTAVVRLKYAGNRHDPFLQYLAANPQFLQCQRVTGRTATS